MLALILSFALRASLSLTLNQIIFRFVTGFLRRHKLLILYGVSLALLLFLLKWLQWRFLIIDNSAEIYIGIIAVLFMGLGIWLAGKLNKPKVLQVVIEKKVFLPSNGVFVQDTREIDALGISARELEVLELMAKGHSNTEIASQLFVSLSTVKTHSSNLFRKLEVQRRTQAIEKAKRLSIIP